MPSLRSLHLGLALCALTSLKIGTLSADPVPPRPFRPKAPAQPPVPPPKSPADECNQRRYIQPNGPDFNGTRVGAADPCVKPPPLSVAHLGKLSLDGKTVVTTAVLKDGGVSIGAASGTQLAGALFLGETSDHGTVRLRIDGVSQAPDPNRKTPENENGDVWLYRVSAQRGSGQSPVDSEFRAAGAYSDLCPNQGQALIVPGFWDFTVNGSNSGAKLSSDVRDVTFACLGSAVAKCVNVMGYKPWKNVTPPGGQPVSLDSFHQTCVRAVRADYCGTSQPLTESGQQVNFYDHVGVQADGADWKLEALWSPTGALCVNSTRLATVVNGETNGQPLQVLDYVKQHCAPLLSLKPCNEVVKQGVLLWTEISPAAPGSPASRRLATPK